MKKHHLKTVQRIFLFVFVFALEQGLLDENF